MIAKILPILLILVGLGAGLGAGLFLRPADEHVEAEASTSEEVPAVSEFVKLNNQFVIPVVEKGRVAALVIMSLNVEVTLGATEAIFSQEPKLRDAMLQIMFDHANAGGFKGVFTDGANLIVLRRALTESAQNIMGEVVKDVLISDLSRQDS
ncbi:flagellar basal body-associated protein FliL [Pseudorhodobacter ferrugineus]|uniref:flagellar basal body-associated protein FliL n=1 Tax=Pseudorhodobacter ferrugineus TaxID=77008 RepID=UPI0003B5E399|nr:flagellar basal body-associated protein FliL [Pseudorhodobacter ferrugineus]